MPASEAESQVLLAPDGESPARKAKAPARRA